MTDAWPESQEYLARSLFRRPESDLEFIFASAKEIERILVGETLVLIPCHVGDVSAAVHTSELICVQGAPVCIFVNCLVDEQGEDEFEEVIEKCRELSAYVEKSTGVPIVVIGRRHGKTRLMGAVRGIVSDAAIVAMLNRGMTSNIAFVDADTLDVSPEYIRSLTDAFAHSRPMMVTGPVHYGVKPCGEPCNRRGTSIPELTLADRVNQAILRCARDGEINFERRVWPEGASFAFDATSYCRVNGFDWDLSCGEDDAFGRVMHRFNPQAFARPVRGFEAVYETRFSNIAFIPEAWLVTDPRRHLNAIALGGGGTEAWDLTPFDEASGHNLSGAELERHYDAHKDRITWAKLLAWEAQSISIDSWGADRVVKLVKRMLQADRRIRNAAQCANVWKRLGFANGEPASTAESQTMEVCGHLLRTHS